MRRSAAAANIAVLDDQRVGRIVRALRRRRGWRQIDLAKRSACSQSLVSLIERGHLNSVSVRTLRRLLGELDARVAVVVSWRAGELDRLLDEDHAQLVGAAASALRRLGWLVQTEVTYARYREQGSYDTLAFHPATRCLLVVEVKTDLPSAEAMLRKLDEKVRLARAVANERFGWQGRTVSRVLVMPEDRTLRRRVTRLAELLESALPARSVAMRRWLAAPDGLVGGVWFLTTNSRGGVGRRPGGRSRVRLPKRLSNTTADAA
jgi:transcriptional regulator with XRE-family HTH domain